jgi:preprotein translocase subunit SecG
MSALLIVHIVICILLIIVVLLQASSGMDLGSAFGSGGTSDSFFGSKGTSGFFIKVTTVLAAVFMIISLFMSYNVSKGKKSVVEGMKVPAKSSQQQPVIPTLPTKK